MLNLRLFNFSQEDYEAVASIHKIAYPDSHNTAEDFKRIDDYSPQDKYDWERTIAEWNGRPVGYGLYVRSLWLKDPTLYTIGWLTHPDFRRRGICTAYWNHLNKEIIPERAISGLIADVRGDVGDGAQFLENRGFKRSMTTIESELELSAFKPEGYDSLLRKIGDRGIEFHPLSYLIANDPEHMTKLTRLANVHRSDEPTAQEQSPITADEVKSYYMSSSDTYYPDGWFIATHNGNYVGWCAVLPNPKQPADVSNGITVIDRPYRRIGLATAMKVHVIKHAKGMGAERIRTSNVSTNPMLAINLKLGYQPKREEFEYKKLL